MVERPYTVVPDSRTEVAVRKLVQQLCDAIVTKLRPSALLLSGSFARGEGGAYLAGGAVRTTSDLDLVAVYRGPLSLLRSALARRRAAALSAKLRRTFPGADIDLTVRPAVLFTWPPATLDYYDLLRSARVLHGSVSLPPPSAVRLDDIPPDELRRALVKRGVGLLASWLRLSTGETALSEAHAHATEYDIDKAYLASGDMWLHRSDRYHHLLRERMARFSSLRTAAGPTSELRSQYDESARRRLVPGPLVERTANPHLGRWRGAAAEWLRACDLLEEWSRRGDAPRGAHPWRHPARAARQAVGGMRQRLRGLPTQARQQQALPFLIRLALGDREHAWLYPATAELLHASRADQDDLPALMRRFLLAWNHGHAAPASACVPNATLPTAYAWRVPGDMPKAASGV